MGNQQIFVHFENMKLSFIFAAVAFAAETTDKGCYTCKDKCGDKYKEDKLEECDYSYESCYTAQHTNKDGNSVFYRGCESNSDHIKEGCVSDVDGAMVCFETCDKDKCNGDADLTGGAAFTGAATAALLTLFLA